MKPRVLMVHEFYTQRGGEDAVFASECDMLLERGHEVLRFTRHNIDALSTPKWRLAAETVWNRPVQREMYDLIRRERPDVVHFHNTFPLISPAAYYAAASQGVAVVQTLHNYRLFCLKGTFVRDGKPCYDCVGKSLPLAGVTHSCYRGSRAASAAVCGMLGVHRALGTWRGKVDRYIALAQESKDVFVRCGLPAELIRVKPNFVTPDPGPGSGSGGFGLFVGRLSEEKGVASLIAALDALCPTEPFLIVGDGPMAEAVRALVQRQPSVSWLGEIAWARVLELMGRARFVVVPSIWEEPFGRTVIEAFSKGTPVLSSRIGAPGQLVHDGKTGLLFSPGEVEELSQCLRRAYEPTSGLDTMRVAARAEFESKYSAEANYPLLIDTYRSAIQHRFRRQSKDRRATPGLVVNP